MGIFIEEIGKIDGKGVMRWVNGDVFDGCWSNRLRDGYGVYRYANGDVHTGNWKKREHGWKREYEMG